MDSHITVRLLGHGFVVNFYTDILVDTELVKVGYTNDVYKAKHGSLEPVTDDRNAD